MDAGSPAVCQFDESPALGADFFCPGCRERRAWFPENTLGEDGLEPPRVARHPPIGLSRRVPLDPWGPGPP